MTGIMELKAKNEILRKHCDHYKTALEKIREEIAEYKDDRIIHAERNEIIDIVLGIIDKYRGGSN